MDLDKASFSSPINVLSQENNIKAVLTSLILFLVGLKY